MCVCVCVGPVYYTFPFFDISSREIQTESDPVNRFHYVHEKGKALGFVSPCLPPGEPVVKEGPGDSSSRRVVEVGLACLGPCRVGCVGGSCLLTPLQKAAGNSLYARLRVEAGPALDSGPAPTGPSQSPLMEPNLPPGFSQLSGLCCHGRRNQGIWLPRRGGGHNKQRLWFMQQQKKTFVDGALVWSAMCLVWMLLGPLCGQNYKLLAVM